MVQALQEGNLIGRGEWKLSPPHILISCPRCGGINQVGQLWDSHFCCVFCGYDHEVALTPEGQ